MLPLLLAGALGAAAAPPGVVRHDVHVSYTRIVVEGATVACRVRLFTDDLTLALRRQARAPSLTLTEAARADSLFGAYAAERMEVRVDGGVLPGRVVSSGSETDAGGQRMTWYLLEYRAPRPVRRLQLMAGLLFDVHRDQQSLVTVLTLPSERRQTLFFSAGDPKPQGVPL
ncbi:MAG: DUF6702 family protein [Gemmatimonadales bacterium]|nr:DUF6702 family protein [Gemmatimonadales bacterium]